MSNEISDVNKFAKAANCRKVSIPAEMSSNVISDTNDSKSAENMANSLNFLGSMGYAQVNMNNSLTKGVKTSVDSFIDDPEYVQEHNDMCDNLVKDGYPLEEAIDVTDRIFDTLKNEETYK